MKTKTITIESVNKISARLLCVLSILMLSASLCSCGDDDNEPGDSKNNIATKLIGQWVADDDYVTWGYAFSSSGTYRGFEGGGSWYGRYTVSGSTVTMTDGGSIESFVVIAIDDKSMSVRFDGGDGIAQLYKISDSWQ